MNRLKRFLPVLAVIFLLVVVGVGVSYAKYIATLRATGTVTINAELGDITLQEHEAVRQPNGSYELTDVILPIMDNPDSTDVNEEKLGNSYVLIPGLDIPKDPYIVITNKTGIEAYLFVEVVDKTANPALTVTADSAHWLSLGEIGVNGGTVYVYKATADDKTPTAIDSNFPSDPIYILAGNQIIVSQTLLTEDTTAEDTLTFYACMGETAASDKTDFPDKAVEVYNTIQ